MTKAPEKEVNSTKHYAQPPQLKHPRAADIFLHKGCPDEGEKMLGDPGSCIQSLPDASDTGPHTKGLSVGMERTYAL